MEQGKDSRKGRHLARSERMVIERMSRGGYPPRDIAALLARHQRTIERELKRGQVVHKDTEWREHAVYSSDRAQDVHDLNATAKGPELKLGRNYKLAEFLRLRIVVHKESPDVVACQMRKVGMKGTLCTKTIYNYIEQGLVPGVSNESLWEKRKRRKQRSRRLRRDAKSIARGQSIEQRPAEADGREQFGHWEMDLVVGPRGRSKAALLTLVDRKHRGLIIRKLPDRTQASVEAALNGIEKHHGSRRFRQIFKSITVDNGSEFLDFQTLEGSVLARQPRTRIFYAHPYSSWERGSNENANKIIRRFVAKGRDIADFTKHRIMEIERWINQYPRKILDYMTPHELINQELEAIS